MAIRSALIAVVVIVMLFGMCTDDAEATRRVRPTKTPRGRRVIPSAKTSPTTTATTTATTTTTTTTTTAPTTTTTPAITTVVRKTKSRTSKSSKMQPKKSVHNLNTWLGLYLYYSPERMPSADLVCSSTALSKRQQVICSRNSELAAEFVKAARNTVAHCQTQLKHSRWNCSVLDPRTVFGNVLLYGTRQTAFVYALASAALTVTVTKACSSGSLGSCYCDANPNYADINEQVNAMAAQKIHFQKGCSDNVQFGRNLAQAFLDSRGVRSSVAETPARIAMNLHNGETGRLLVESSMKVGCQCLGVSGSCSVKSCARKLPDLRDIASLVKLKFDQSEQLSLTGGISTQLSQRSQNIMKSRPLSLVHIDSYDFCDYDLKRGSIGTRGRLCNGTSNGEDSCKRLCCSRGYEVIQSTRTESCNCEFRFCCKLECRKCTFNVTEHICK